MLRIFHTAAPTTLQAQIQRDLIGLKLAQTTQAQAKSILTQKGYKIETEDGNYIIENVPFAGQKWDVVLLSFHQNKLMKVQFMVEDPSQAIHQLIGSRLIEKYAEYAIDPDIYPAAGLSFVDDQTVINLYIGLPDIFSKKIFSLIYADRALYEAKDAADSSDL